MSLTKAAAKKACKKMYSYSHSPELAMLGQYLHLFKAMLSCKLRRQPMPESLTNSAKRLEVDVEFFDTVSVKDMRQKVTKARKDLRRCQKHDGEERIKWLETLAEDRAKAAGDLDCKTPL